MQTARASRFLKLLHFLQSGDPRTVEEMGEFVGDPDFELAANFGNAWWMIREDVRHRVRILLAPKVAGKVDEVVWRKTQRTVFEKAGSLLFEADVDVFREIVWWVLGYGDRAEVLDPPELREMVLRDARGMCAVYGGKE